MRQDVVRAHVTDYLIGNYYVRPHVVRVTPRRWRFLPRFLTAIPFFRGKPYTVVTLPGPPPAGSIITIWSEVNKMV